MESCVEKGIKVVVDSETVDIDRVTKNLLMRIKASRQSDETQGRRA